MSYNESDLTDFLNQLVSDIRLVSQHVLRYDDTLRGPGEESLQPPKGWDQLQRVWLRDPVYRGSLAPKYKGPYQVIEREYPVLTLEIDGVFKKVNVDRIKPCHEGKTCHPMLLIIITMKTIHRHTLRLE